jgi:hypothetical protein
MAAFASPPKLQFFDINGDPLSGGKVYTYEVTTTTNKATYPTLADAAAQTNANANPVILDSRGEAVIVLTGPTKFRIDDSNDNNIYTVDNYYPSSVGVIFDTNNKKILQLNATANAVNYVEITNAATGNNPQISSEGEANIGLDFYDSNENELLTLDSTASAVNQVNIKNAATGNKPQVNAEGEANQGLTFNDTNANELLTLSSTAAAVNYVEVKNTATTVRPEINAAGEAAMGLIFRDGSGNELFRLSGVSSAVNFIDITNSATGTGCTLTCNGDDTDVSFFVQPKGTGVVGILGTASSSAELRLYEDTDNGTNYTGFKANPNTTSSVTYILPPSDGTNTQVMQTNGSGVLSWVNN